MFSTSIIKGSRKTIISQNYNIWASPANRMCTLLIFSKYLHFLICKEEKNCHEKQPTKSHVPESDRTGGFEVDGTSQRRKDRRKERIKSSSTGGDDTVWLHSVWLINSEPVQRSESGAGVCHNNNNPKKTTRNHYINYPQAVSFQPGPPWRRVSFNFIKQLYTSAAPRRHCGGAFSKPGAKQRKREPLLPHAPR